MKICYVLDDSIFRFGGVQTYILNLAEEFARMGHRVTIIHTTNKNIPLNQNILSLIEITSFSQSFDIPKLNLNGSVSTFPGFLNKKRAREFFLERNFDIVHFNYPFSPFVSGKMLKILSNLRKESKIVSKLFCTFLISVESNSMAHLANLFLAKYQKRYLKNIDKFINISDETKKYGEKYLGLSSDYITVGIPNISIKNIKKDQKKIKVLFLGRLEKRKGALNFVKAINLLDKKILEQTSIKVAGNGPEYEEIKLLNEEKSLNIKILGKVSNDERDKLYKEAHIVIFPAKYGESFGIVLIEAMNYGCLVLGYDNPGYHFTLGPFAIDCLVERGNIQKLGEKIGEFIRDKEKLFRTAEKLKNYFEENYDIKLISKNLEKLYFSELESHQH